MMLHKMNSRRQSKDFLSAFSSGWWLAALVLAAFSGLAALALIRLLVLMGGGNGKKWELRYVDSDVGAGTEKVIGFSGDQYGQATIASGNTEVAVTFTKNHASGSYKVFCTPRSGSENVWCKASSEGEDGFTLERSGDVSPLGALTVDWFLIRYVV